MTTHTIKRYKNSMRKFGFAGFKFFFVKGMLWLIVPTIVVWFN